MKKFLLVFFLGASVGAVLASLFGPTFISWYFEPPVYVGVSCQAAAVWAVNTFQKVQIGALVLGGVLLSALFYSIFGSKNPPKQLN